MRGQTPAADPTLLVASESADPEKSPTASSQSLAVSLPAPPPTTTTTPTMECAAAPRRHSAPHASRARAARRTRSTSPTRASAVAAAAVTVVLTPSPSPTPRPARNIRSHEFHGMRHLLFRVHQATPAASPTSALKTPAAAAEVSGRSTAVQRTSPRHSSGGGGGGSSSSRSSKHKPHRIETRPPWGQDRRRSVAKLSRGQAY